MNATLLATVTFFIFYVIVHLSTGTANELSLPGNTSSSSSVPVVNSTEGSAIARAGTLSSFSANPKKTVKIGYLTSLKGTFEGLAISGALTYAIDQVCVSIFFSLYFILSNIEI